MKDIPAKINKKFTSLHPVPILGVMSVFIVPSIFITHSTPNLATHAHLKHLTFAFSVSFAIVFGILLLAKFYNELGRMQKLNKQKGVEFSLPAIFTGMLISLGGICVAFAGGFSSANVINALDSSIPSQAKEISRQTAALNYYLIAGAVTLLIGYWIIHASLNSSSKNAGVSNKADPSNMGLLEAMQKTSCFWFLPLIGLGIAGAFALKGAAQVTHAQIVIYSTIIFLAGLMIAMPKMLHAWHKNHQTCQLEGQGHDIPWKLYMTILLMGATFTCFGAGLNSAILYHDPLWGSIFMVVGMAPMLLMSILSDRASANMQGVDPMSINAVNYNDDKQQNYQLMGDDDADHENNNESSKIFTNH